MSSLSNLEGEEVFEASSLGQCDYVGQERISDDELIIIKGTFFDYGPELGRYDYFI